MTVKDGANEMNTEMLLWVIVVWLMALSTILFFKKAGFAPVLPQNQFDKYLLAFFVIYFSIIGWHAVFHIDTSSPFEQAFMNAMLDNQKLVIGALLGLITGRAIGRGDPPATGFTIEQTKEKP
jgi:E3 ubiquitin-protein ligase DOA10